MSEDDRLDELERRVAELAAVLAELLQDNPEASSRYRDRRTGIPGPTTFTKTVVEDWFEERIRPV